MTFFVPGLPQPGGSKQVFQHPEVYQVLRQLDSGTSVTRQALEAALRKRPIITDDNRRGRDWRLAAAQAAIEAGVKPLGGAVILRFMFLMPRPKGHFGTGRNAGQLRESAPRYPTVKPDATKLARGTEDALKGIAWRDDAQVVAQVIVKHYADLGQVPGAWITIEEKQ